MNPFSRIIRKKAGLNLSDGDGAFRTNLDAGFTSKTFVHVYRLGLAINHFIYLRRASIYTFFIPNALVLVDNNFPHNQTSIELIVKLFKISHSFHKRNNLVIIFFPFYPPRVLSL